MGWRLLGQQKIDRFAAGFIIKNELGLTIMGDNTINSGGIGNNYLLNEEK